MGAQSNLEQVHRLKTAANSWDVRADAACQLMRDSRSLLNGMAEALDDIKNEHAAEAGLARMGMR